MTVLERLQALVRSGRVHPLRPLAAPSTLPHRDRFAAAGASVLKALSSLLPHASLTAGLDEPPGLREVVQRELVEGRGLGFTRLDVVCPHDAPAAFQLLEVQAGDPSAMGWRDELAVLFGEEPTLLPAHRLALEALTPGRRMAFVVARGSVVESDHRLLAEHYAQHGWSSTVVDPRELHFDGRALLARGEPVDAVFRDAFEELFTGEFAPGGAALVAAARAEAVVVMNPFVAGLADDKALLEPLSTPGRWSPELAEVLRAHVPCTRVVRERRVDWEGREVDLVDFLRGAREQTVLKPADGYGGFGITMGPFVTAAAWDTALDEALRKPGHYVAQRYHPLPREQVEMFDGTREAYVVHSLWFQPVRGVPALTGAYSRAAPQPVVNVHQGGGLAPVFFRPPFS
ncbi:MAG: circularly permuted type 2 ATP-grasp protein [Archangium sp.]|nr:circularly permuted type 2 ATP-grasp protein [Archangium sp.]